MSVLCSTRIVIGATVLESVELERDLVCLLDALTQQECLGSLVRNGTARQLLSGSGAHPVFDLYTLIYAGTCSTSTYQQIDQVVRHTLSEIDLVECS